MQPFILS